MTLENEATAVRYYSRHQFSSRRGLTGGILRSAGYPPSMFIPERIDGGLGELMARKPEVGWVGWAIGLLRTFEHPPGSPANCDVVLEQDGAMNEFADFPHAHAALLGPIQNASLADELVRLAVECGGSLAEPAWD